MYDWLHDALDESTCVVTANRRLARELHNSWSAHKLAEGAAAWRTPDIQPWTSWLGAMLASSRRQDGIPTRINAHQSQLLWERCLRKELDDVLQRHGADAMQFLSPKKHLVKGVPRREIPALAKRLGADLVVMGTVARTGVPGFFIGNTAETILRSVRCSVLAVKPEGFVSPVRIQRQPNRGSGEP